MNRWAMAVSALALGVMMGLANAAAAPKPAPASTDQAQAAGWNLGDLYPSPEAWTTAHDAIKAETDTLDRFKGTLGQSPASLFSALDAISHASKEVNRLYVYASLKGDEDVRVAANQERLQAAGALQTELGEKTAWVTPELLAVGADKIRKFEEQSPELKKRFAQFLDNTLRAAPHTLSTESEEVIASAGNVLAQPNNIYQALASGDLPFPTVTLSDGTRVQLTQAMYTKYRQSPVRADRKLVFDSFFGAFKKYEGTLGQNLTTQVMSEEFTAKVKHYPSALSAALFQDNMPDAVYRQLVAQANAGLPAMYRYLRMRKELLGIKDGLRYYDIYPSMFKLARPLHFSVADSERIGLEVTAAYGDEYAGLLRKGFNSNWMDVYPRLGKTPGAYMNGSAYDVHPYLHLNHNDDYQALTTFVHEWGHAVHTLLTDETQPYENSNYSTFIAETASIGNEMLLNDYMVQHAADDSEKLFYLGEGLELIRGTFFRQTMLAQFQLAIHEELENGKPLSGPRMTELYCDLLKKYHGEAEGVMTIDPTYCVEWAYIPHMYYGFYVWQYSTSMAGAASLTQAIEKEGAPARDRFIAMLKAGSSDYPYELYKKAGIDMASPEPYQALVARMNRIMDQIDAIRSKKK